MGPLGSPDANIISMQTDSSSHCETMDMAPLHSMVMPVYSTGFAGTYFAYPGGDGQAELTWGG